MKSRINCKNYTIENLQSRIFNNSNFSTKLYFKKSCEKFFKTQICLFISQYFFLNLFSNCPASKNNKVLHFIHYYILMNECEIVENKFQKIFYEYSYQYIRVIAFCTFLFCCWEFFSKHKFVYFAVFFFQIDFSIFSHLKIIMNPFKKNRRKKNQT